MKLNVDCVRDILLCVESNTGPHHECRFVDIGSYANDVRRALGDDLRPVEVPDYQLPLLDAYGNDTLIYHVQYCIEADLLKQRGPISGEAGIFAIPGLTVRGHDLIDNVREKTTWDSVKAIFSRTGGFGVDVLVSVAGDLAAAQAKDLLGL